MPEAGLENDIGDPSATEKVNAARACAESIEGEPWHANVLAAPQDPRSSTQPKERPTMPTHTNCLDSNRFRLKTRASCLLAASLLCVSGASMASIVVSESFSYADGALAGGNDGVGWGSAWTGGGSVVGGVATLAGSSGGTRSLSTAIVPTAGQSFYLGMSIGADPSASAFDYAGLAFLSGGVDRLFFGMPFERDNYGFGVNGYTTQESGIAASTLPSYLVAQILFNSASSITVNLFVDPVGALGTASATYTGTMMSGSWDSVRIVNNNSPSSFDNIVIGTTLADVYSPDELSVPEPSSFALAGLALLALSGVNRRRGAN